MENAHSAVDSQTIRGILTEVLGNSALVESLSNDDPLIGAVAELDSLAVANLIVALEDHYDFLVDEIDVRESAFSSINALVDFTKSQFSS